MKLMRNILFCVLAAVSLWGCSAAMEPDWQDRTYGYVQFKVYKTATKSRLEYLADVTKVKVTLRYEGNLISQTLVMTASDDAAAEYGLRSGKLKLLAGRYDVLTFSLLDKMDEVIYDGTPSSEDSSFEVRPGGLFVHDLFADTVERGRVKFTIVKDLSDFKDMPSTKAAERTYTFDDIEAISINVRSDAGVKTVFEKLPAEFSIHFDDSDEVEDGYQTSSFVCDTLLPLVAGSYVIESYSVYDENKMLLETNSRVSAGFEVRDNQTTDAKIPVRLYESDEYIKDYYALYEIWKSLHGEEWKYVGEDYTPGSNWDFNKDPDLWGDQPGVSLHSNGRVALINISGFGFYGDLSPAIGQLTELVELYLGTHNDSNLLHHDPTVNPGAGTTNRMERHKEFLRAMHPATQMAEPIARALAERNITIPETAMYRTMPEKDVIDASTGRMLIRPMDLNHGKLCNGLTSIPAEIGRLTKLEQIFIANGELTGLPAEMANLESLTDMELYNCPMMTSFPMVLAKLPSLVSLNIANNRQWSADELLAGLKALAGGPSAEKIQLLYVNQNSLEVIPAEITKMKKLGLLDFADNNIHTIETPWGNDIKPVQLYLDGNQLSSFPVDDATGVFCFLDDAETFSVRDNKFTEFPDIFDAESQFTISSIDFSYNEIKGFQNGENFKGVKVNTLTLANNSPLEEYPLAIAQSNSTVAYINLRGCNIKEIPDGAFEYENSVHLTSLDLSYNDLSDLPDDMHAGNLPYLYGVELSYNHFKEFPREPLDSQYLTVFAIRSQRDDNGARCLSEWPEGIYNHRGLRGFYIGSNNLGKINDTISTICYYLDISDNPDIIFDASDICYAIQQGAYILIYDKTQDIRNCDILLD